MKRVWNLGIIAVRGLSSCTSCSKSLKNGVVCSACGTMQPKHPEMSHFEYLGMEKRYNVDTTALKKTFLELQSRVHPDKASHAEKDVKDLLEAHSSQLNSAYKILSDPIQRAEYMLGTKEENQPAESNEFLMEMIEMGEMIEKTKSEKKLKGIRDELLEEVNKLKKELGEHFAASRTQEAAQALVRLRYHLRLMTNVNTRLGFDAKE